MPRRRSITNDGCVPGAVRRGETLVDGRDYPRVTRLAPDVNVASTRPDMRTPRATNCRLRDNLAISLKRNIFTRPGRESAARLVRWMISRFPRLDLGPEGPSSCQALLFMPARTFILLAPNNRGPDSRKPSESRGRSAIDEVDLPPPMQPGTLRSNYNEGRSRNTPKPDTPKPVNFENRGNRN